MKHLLTLSLAALMLFFGCEQGSNTTSPETLSTSEQSVNWITLPSPSDMSLYKGGGNGGGGNKGGGGKNGGDTPSGPSFTNSELIDGILGGHVMLVTQYDGGPFGLVRIDSKLEIMQNAFDGTKEISTTCFPEDGLVQFGPAGLFDIDLEYTLVFEGLDLSGIDPDKVKFCYVDSKGRVVETQNLGVTVDISAGKIKVDKAYLPHFSRYGFVNRQF